MTVRRGSLVALLALLLVAVTIPAAPPALAASWPPIPGYGITTVQRLAPGLTYVQYRSSKPERVVNLAMLDPAHAGRFMPLLSNGRFAGDLTTETTSSMCRRWRCRLAINGDFFSIANGQPVGGMIVDGRSLRSPARNVNFRLDRSGTFSVGGPIAASATLRFTSVVREDGGPLPPLEQPPGDVETTTSIVNYPRPSDGPFAIYTPEWGRTTEQPDGGFELVGKVLNPPILAGKPLRVRMIRGVDQGDSWIPDDGIVFSGHGRSAEELSHIWTRIAAGVLEPEADLNVSFAEPIKRLVGGNLTLVAKNRDQMAGRAGSFYNARHPRTMIGRTGHGAVVAAVVDGRRTGWSVGMSLREAAQFMRSIGVTDAINLDGGGSATFVKYGRVINKPSGTKERPVASAVAFL